MNQAEIKTALHNIRIALEEEKYFQSMPISALCGVRGLVDSLLGKIEKKENPTSPIELRDSHFGQWFDFLDRIPEREDIVIVCADTKSGRVPKKILLSHQVYLKTVDEILAESNTTGVSVYPVESKNAIQLKAKP